MGKKGSETSSTQREYISAEDAAATRRGRMAGTRAADAAMRGYTVGADPNTMAALGNYQDLYGLYGDLFTYGQGIGQSALGFAGQTGLRGLDRYANPYIGMQLAGMDPLFARQRANVGTQSDQNAILQGAYGGSRAAVGRAMAEGLIDENQASMYGNIYSQGAAQAAQMMMAERARMQGLGQFGLGLSQAGLSGMGGVNQNIASLGDYFRQITQGQANDPWVNAERARQAELGSYGRDISRTTTTNTKEQKGWAEGILPAAMQIGSMFIPGGQIALPALSAWGIGSNSPAFQSTMANLAGLQANPWQGMNLGTPQFGVQGPSPALFQNANLGLGPFQPPQGGLSTLGGSW